MLILYLHIGLSRKTILGSDFWCQTSMQRKVVWMRFNGYFSFFVDKLFCKLKSAKLQINLLFDDFKPQSITLTFLPPVNNTDLIVKFRCNTLLVYVMKFCKSQISR
jgi:hypothetical protein